MKFKKGRTKSRLPYSADDLNVIFNFPVYTEGKRPKGGGGEVAFWLPLMAAFTGARMEEVGQILVEDIKQDQGIWFIDMQDVSDDHHFKNAVYAVGFLFISC